MATTLQPSQFTGNSSILRGHICAFFNSIDEQRRVLKPFITDGFDQQDRAYHIVDPEQREGHLRWLAEAGIDVRGAMSTGQLEVRPWQDGPLGNVSLDPGTWMVACEQVLQLGVGGRVRTHTIRGADGMGARPAVGGRRPVRVRDAAQLCDSQVRGLGYLLVQPP